MLDVFRNVLAAVLILVAIACYLSPAALGSYKPTIFEFYVFPVISIVLIGAALLCIGYVPNLH